MSITIRYNINYITNLRGKALNKICLAKLEKMAKRTKTLVYVMGRTLKPNTEVKKTELKDDAELSATERKISGALMRVNHAGEIAAQGLYMGQALFARSEKTYDFMLDASEEELKHLEACHRRLAELGEEVSIFSPVWFLGSVLIGSFFGLQGDKISLGFISETERQVENHLKGHLSKISKKDSLTRDLLKGMIEDEREHGDGAKENGGVLESEFISSMMAITSEIMKQVSYKL